MDAIARAIREIVAEEVAQAEKRIRENLSIAPDRTLSAKEAAEYLHMSEYTLRNLCRAKRIPHRIHGSEGSKNPRYWFRTSQLDNWIREQEDQNYIREGMI